MSDSERWRPSTRIVHAAGNPDRETGALTPPIHLATTFERAADGSLPHGNLYARTESPTRERLEAALAGLEGGAGALGFGSGTAAMAAVLMALRPGARVVAPHDGYIGTRHTFEELRPWGIDAVTVDMTDLDQVRSACADHCALIWIETPANPSLRITDIAAVVEIARHAGALVAVDNTVPTPLLTRPLDLGADIAVHSTTKLISGHGDLLGGAVIARDAGRLAALESLRTNLGAVPSAFDCWLSLRGLRTLALRSRAANDNADRLAAFLAEHRRVSRVRYPGLPDHPDHAIARRQMARFGALLAFEVPGGAEDAVAVAGQLRLIRRATSLGGLETTIEHRATIEGPDAPTPPGLLRVSVGIEDAEDLVEDLGQALG